MDNCVGKRNYKYFFFFIVSLNLFILSGFAWGLLSIWLYRKDLIKVVVEYPALVLLMSIVVTLFSIVYFSVTFICTYYVASFPGLPPHARNVTRKKIAKLGEGLVRNIT